MNLFRIIIYMCIYFCVQNIIIFTFYFSMRADINAGLISSIWSVTPFVFCLMDYIFFGVKLQTHHYIGVSCTAVCTVLLSLTNVFYPPENDPHKVSVATVQPVVPVLFGLATPIFFTSFGLFHKHCTSERIGFNP